MDLQYDQPNEYFKDHVFDLPRERGKSRKRRSDITTGHNPMTGVQGVRTNYKIDDSKVLPTTRFRVVANTDIATDQL